MDWKLVYGILRVVLLVAVLIYTWWVNREKVTAKRFANVEREVAKRLSLSEHQVLDEKQKKQCEEHERRTGKAEQDLRRLEAEIRHLPTSRDLSDLNGKLSSIEGTLSGLRRAVDLMNEHLLNGGNKR